MAVFPCSAEPHRYPGPQRSAYITLAEGSTTQTRKLRLCPTHYGIVADVVAGHLAYVDGESEISHDCDSCGQDAQAHVYVTLYDTQSEGAAWAGDFCRACMSRVANQLLWTRGIER